MGHVCGEQISPQEESMKKERIRWEVSEYNPVDGYFALISRNGRLFAKVFSKAEALEIIEAMTQARKGRVTQ